MRISNFVVTDLASVSNVIETNYRGILNPVKVFERLSRQCNLYPLNGRSTLVFSVSEGIVNNRPLVTENYIVHGLRANALRCEMELSLKLSNECEDTFFARIITNTNAEVPLNELMNKKIEGVAVTYMLYPNSMSIFIVSNNIDSFSKAIALI